ncbi:hypothetical protein [Neisseria yangbaofengii]|nr:hypothetical protein [Neisseria yangbaofengii]
MWLGEAVRITAIGRVIALIELPLLRVIWGALGRCEVMRNADLGVELV